MSKESDEFKKVLESFELGKYYRSFMAIGVCSLEDFSYLSGNDLYKIGIDSDNSDYKKLLELSSLVSMRYRKQKRNKKKSLMLIVLITVMVVLLADVGIMIVCGKSFHLCFHNWINATCIEPKHCSKCGITIGEELGHDWKDATCINPMTCNRCGETEGKALGHHWIDASCIEPKTCSTCGLKVGTPMGHKWLAETALLPKRCANCDEMKPKGNPNNGQVFIDNSPFNKLSAITIKSSTKEAHYVKLKDSKKNDILSFYVSPGSTVTVNVPVGSYYVYFASGNNWYGPEYLFGKETLYSMDSSIQDFDKFTISYTLYPVINGNFQETPIDASEF